MLQMINELESYSTNPGFVEINNMGGFIASFSVSYTLNGQDFTKESGSFSLFFSRNIPIPSDAQNIHILILAANGLGQWAPIYNNHWNSPGILKGKLYGTIFSPQLEIFSDSKPPKFIASVSNNAGFVCDYILKYTFNDKTYSIDSGNFTLGVTRNINIPETAKNINILVIQNLDSALPEQYKIYSKDFSEALNIKLRVSGTISSPKVEQLASIPNVGSGIDPNIPLIKISKTPNKTQVALGEKLNFSIKISNISGSTAKMLIISENLPSEASFVPNSFVLNGRKIIGNYLPTKGLLLKDMNVNDSITLTYEVIFNKIPAKNPVQDKPMLNYNYVNSKGKILNTSIIGDTISLNILNNIPTNSQNNCCICCCQTNNLTFSQYTDYLSYMKSMGYI